MEERLLKLLDIEQLSSSKFADAIGVQRSSVSHILSGRNKPSFDFLQKTLKAFPYLNADWLILGEGKMYENEEVALGGNLFDQPLDTSTETVEKESVFMQNQVTESPLESNISEDDELDAEKSGSEEFSFDKSSILQKKNKVIKRVMIFYTDSTFESFDPQ